MNRLMMFPDSVKRDPAIDHWFESHSLVETAYLDMKQLLGRQDA